VLLERFLADDLGVDLRRHIEAERDARPEVRARLDELATDRRSFLAADPPADFARRLAGCLEMEQSAAAAAAAAPARPRRWLAWVLGPSAAAAAVALFATFTVTQMSSDESISVAVDGSPAPQTTPAEVAATAPPVAVVPEGEPAPDRPAVREQPGKRAKSKARKLDKKRPRAKPGAVKAPDRSPEPKPPPPPKPPPALESPPPVEDPAPVVEAAGGAADMEVGAPAAPSVPRALGTVSKSSRGGLRHKQIMKALRKEVHALQACMKSSEEVSAGVYTLDLVWEITARGGVKEPKVEGPASLRNTSLARCVVEEMRTWRFPKADAPTPVRVPIRVTVE